MKEIIFYQTENNKYPVVEFLDSLSGKEAQKVVWVLKIIEEFENVPTKFFKKLINTDDIWEIRVDGLNKIYRILGFIEDKKFVVLNHAFVKKTQKTPEKEIKIAENRKKDYLRRKNE